MGSLKDEKQVLMEDHQPCEKTKNEGLSEGSDGSAAAEGCPLRACQESTSLEDCRPTLHIDSSSVEVRENYLKAKDPELSGVDCESTDASVSEPVKNCPQPDSMLVKTVAAQNEATVSIKNQRKGDPDGENKGIDKGKGTDIQNISVPVPSTPGPSDPRSPAPFGQQHMRTQVSLEVVQCCSAATSPMTPPEGDHSFFFPSNFGKHGAVASAACIKDAELQVGHEVEFCSVATSPMTPKTPSITAFPVLVGKGSGQKEEKMKNKEEQRESDQKMAKCTGEVSQKEESLKCAMSKEIGEGLSSNKSVARSQVTFEDSTQQCMQQRAGSMDQDITILVTHYGNNEEEGEENAESHFQTLEPEMVKIEETEKVGENISNIKSEDRKETASTVAPDHAREKSSPKQPQKLPEKPQDCAEADNSEVTTCKVAQVEVRDFSVPRSPVPESPAPFGCHNIRTQVSLEVVQCQSVATSPMTPPEGDQAFYFPSSLGKCGHVGTETKDVELQVGQQVEYRSIATAPMTPRTPVATTFPEIKKEVSIDEKIPEEKEEEKREQVIENKKEVLKEEEKLTQNENAEKDSKVVINSEEKDEEKCEEPVQEVSWDEKGMTWDVYGAVVEVAVLGSAIQKHLEKQVQKQKQLASMPPPPPLNPSASPFPSEPGCGGSGKRRGRKKAEHDGKASRRRRNPFRSLMENVQQPHCCSKAHTTE